MSRRSQADEPLSDDDIAELFEVWAGLGADPAPLLLAVSGGPDSTVLMRAAVAWSEAAAARGLAVPAFHVATVDHGLRPAARAEALAVRDVATALGLPHAVLAWTERPVAARGQAAAREARYRLLAAEARRVGAPRIATAHTRDDQAETALMRLAAGSGLSGLGGMRSEAPLDGLTIVRPLLPVAKARLVATCRARGWPFALDPSNADPRHARVRWRGLMPALAQEGLDADRLWRFTSRMQRADLALEQMAEAASSRLVERHGVALRVFRAAVASRGEGEPVRLGRAEAALAAFRAARLAGVSARRTLAGCLLSLDRSGVLSIRPEPLRQRGRR